MLRFHLLLSVLLLSLAVGSPNAVVTAASHDDRSSALQNLANLGASVRVRTRQGGHRVYTSNQFTPSNGNDGAPGSHFYTIVDSNGNRATQIFDNNAHGSHSEIVPPRTRNNNNIGEVHVPEMSDLHYTKILVQPDTKIYNPGNQLLFPVTATGQPVEWPELVIKGHNKFFRQHMPFVTYPLAVLIVDQQPPIKGTLFCPKEQGALSPNVMKQVYATPDTKDQPLDTPVILTPTITFSVFRVGEGWRRCAFNKLPPGAEANPADAVPSNRVGIHMPKLYLAGMLKFMQIASTVPNIEYHSDMFNSTTYVRPNNNNNRPGSPGAGQMRSGAAQVYMQFILPPPMFSSYFIMDAVVELHKLLDQTALVKTSSDELKTIKQQLIGIQSNHDTFDVKAAAIILVIKDILKRLPATTR